jgi:hypothetical protein
MICAFVVDFGLCFLAIWYIISLLINVASRIKEGAR